MLKHNKLLSYPKASEDIVYQVQALLDSGPDQIIGSLEYMIKKVTTHPDQMKEVDFIAAGNGRKLISFLQFAKIYNIKNYE